MGILSNVKYNKNISLVHFDERREIYDPSKILNGLVGRWYPHNIIAILKDNTILGDHYHDFNEVFFTPTGGFYFILVDINNLKKCKCYKLEKGCRILIPAYTAHRVICKKDSILIGFGSAKFNRKRLFSCNKEIISIFEKIIE